MQTELNVIVRGFRANVMAEILYHRTLSGEGVVPSFVTNVTKHCHNTTRKFDDIRASHLLASTISEVAKAESIVKELARSETERAIKAGAVEFAASEAL